MKHLCALFLFAWGTAVAVPEAMLSMPPDKSYMSFVLTKYLRWHSENFDFPKSDPVISSLLSGVDNWLVPGTTDRQFTLTHEETGIMRLRIFVAPALRGSLKTFEVPGIPPERLRFLEASSDGQTCVSFEAGRKILEVYCKGVKENRFTFSWSEKEDVPVPDRWPLSFPRTGPDVIVREKRGQVERVTFHPVVTHPSRIPTTLRKALNLHSAEARLPLDRLSTDSEGRLFLHYP